MGPDVTDLRDFYQARLGRVARYLVRKKVRQVWPDVKGLDLLGVGYATPYLKQFIGEAARVIALMPSTQGVHRWPMLGPNLVALGDDREIPLGDDCVSRILLIHGLENTETVAPFLREIWRILAPGGRLLVVVPNRRGIWARSDKTPFGSGYPYSRRQLYRLLRDNMFQPTQRGTALFVPPVKLRLLLRTAPVWENIGQNWAQAVAGVHLVESEKQIYAATGLNASRKSKPVTLSLPSRPNFTTSRVA